MLNLENITLVSMTSVGIEPTIKALEYSCKDINFGSVKLISDIKPDNLPNNIIHEDGFIVNADMWNPKFLEYDYIGAPWPLPNDDFSYRDIKNNIVRVGNSVSLRSKKLIDLPVKLNLEWKPFHGYYNEDGFICVNNRHIYEEYGCKFANIDIAKYFSHETMIPEIEGIKPFAFHRHYGTNSKYPNYGK
jgi:hypothetical protein